MGKTAKRTLILAASGLVALALWATFSAPTVAHADAPADYAYNELYRDQLSYSPKFGWNNDPNGLLYANGVYHMYYQYNYDHRNGSTENVWGNMSWGHATSADLVNWEEKPVALPAYVSGEDGKTYEMMFSGSAVYDADNKSGLFPGGSGIVAFLTQPCDAEGGQRQILAYSTDGGDSFTVVREIIGADGAWSLGDGEFRDPKVFWSAEKNKWLMAVGGGAVRMFSSDNLVDWTYIGDTGYWGECPDISVYDVDGTPMYALILSPEDKAQSNEHNGTNRRDHYLPAEYYVLGHLGTDGLFVGDTEMRRFTQGVDGYAFQSFNHAPDGKVYGVSWSACWKNVNEYKDYRENYNGGITIACELNIVKDGEDYVLTRKPVEALSTLRKPTPVATYDGELKAGVNAFADKHATVADMEVSLDFTGSAAKHAELKLRSSDCEHILIRYDVDTHMLTLDRAESSLLAKKVNLYATEYTAAAPLIDGKLDLRIVLDRGSVSVFAAGGRTSWFCAAFPALASDGLELTADGDINVKADVYDMNGIFGTLPANDTLYLTAEKIDMTVHGTEYIMASSLAAGFKNSDVTYTVTTGEDVVELIVNDSYTAVKGLQAGHARITARYGTKTRRIDVYVYASDYGGNVEYKTPQNVYSYYGSDGLMLNSWENTDGFMFADVGGTDISYCATLIPANEDAQAGAIVFGVSDNLYDYYVASVDYKDKKLKLWRAGVGDLKVMNIWVEKGEPVEINVEVYDKKISVWLTYYYAARMTYEANDYVGGRVGLNVYNASMSFYGVELNAITAPTEDESEGYGNVGFDGAESLFYGEDMLVVRAETANAAVSDKSGADVSLRAELDPRSDSYTAGGFVFGISDDLSDYYTAYVDYSENKLKVMHLDETVAEMTVYLSTENPLTLNLEVNGGKARMWLEEYKYLLTCTLDGYTGGKIGLGAVQADMGFRDVTYVAIPSSGTGCFAGEREILGVVNMTDGNSTVAEGAYTVTNGVVDVTDAYMLTLIGGKTYTFKVITEREALYFTRTPGFDELAVSYTPPEKAGSGISFTLGSDVKVSSVYIGETEVAFTQTGKTVFVEPGALVDIGEGEHYVSVYTDGGRADLKVTLRHEYWQGVNLGLIIPLALVCAAIVAGAAVLFVMMYRKQKSAEAAGADNSTAVDNAAEPEEAESGEESNGKTE